MGHAFARSSAPGIPRDICEICGGRAAGHRDRVEALEKGRRPATPRQHHVEPTVVWRNSIGDLVTDLRDALGDAWLPFVREIGKIAIEDERAENQRLREALVSAVRASGIEDGDTAESVRRGFVKLGELAVAIVAARDVLK